MRISTMPTLLLGMETDRRPAGTASTSRTRPMNTNGNSDATSDMTPSPHAGVLCAVRPEGAGGRPGRNQRTSVAPARGSGTAGAAAWTNASAGPRGIQAEPVKSRRIAGLVWYHFRARGREPARSPACRGRLWRERLGCPRGGNPMLKRIALTLFLVITVAVVAVLAIAATRPAQPRRAQPLDGGAARAGVRGVERPPPFPRVVAVAETGSRHEGHVRRATERGGRSYSWVGNSEAGEGA